MNPDNITLRSIPSIDSGAVLKPSSRGRWAVHRTYVPRLRREGLTVWKADECATRLGTDPTTLWGAEWERAANDAAAPFRATSRVVGDAPR